MTALTLEQQALAAAPEHLATARRIASWWGRRHPHLADEFEGEALLALCLAAMDFDPARSPSFAGFAFWRCQRAMSRLVRKWILRWRRHGGPVVCCPGGLRLVVVATDPPIGWRIELLDELAARERRIWPWYAGPTTGGERMRRTRARRAERRAIVELRRRLGAMEGVA